MKDKQTVTCVCCLKRRAQIWGGYVLRGGKKPEKVIAGWCRRCMKATQPMGDDSGFSGHWQPSMGAKDMRI